MASHVLCIVKFLFAILTFIGFYFNCSFAQTFSEVSVLVKNHLASSETPTTIKVYKTSNQQITIHKASVSGATLGEQSLNFTGTNRTGAIISSNDDLSATLSLTGLVQTKVGIYTVNVTQDQQEDFVQLRILILNNNASVTPMEYSTVVLKGDSVTLSAKEKPGGTVNSLRWRKNGVFQGDPCFNTRSCTQENAQKSIVFECFVAGEYRDGKHAIMNLIVRECPEGQWEPTDCAQRCPRCFNGGICSDKTGLCQCPPGFSGTNCEQVHGRNVFGQSGEHKCNETGDDHSAGCKGALICYPNPFGCVCPAGYTGLNCTEECEDGKFGANCKQTCHCQENVPCAKDTGVCGDNQCSMGWKGVNCQVVDPCEVGVYGDLCIKNCSCSDGNCREVEVNCVRGCAEQWIGLACDQNEPGRINITYVKVNPNVETSVTCSAISNPVTRKANLRLTFGGAIISPTEAVSSLHNRSYSRNNTWMVTLRSNSVARTAVCSIHNSEIRSELILSPYELPSYSGGNPLTVSNVTSTYIRVTWHAWSEGTDNGDGPILRYQIRYRASEAPGPWMSAFISTGTNLEAEFRDLTPDTEYDFQVRVVRDGERGAGPFNGVIPQRTPCGVPSERPQIRLTSQTPRTAQFSVQIPARNTWNCNSVTVELQRQPTDGAWEHAKFILQRSSTFTTVYNLIPCSRYSFRVRISTDIGSLDSVPETFEAAPEALGMVGNLQVTEMNRQGRLGVSWDAPDVSQNNCPIDSYTVRYRLSRYSECRTGEGSDDLNKFTTTSQTSHVLRNLEAYAYYRVGVHANGRINSSVATLSERTAETAPSAAPINVEQTDTQPTSLQFSWARPPCRNRNGVITKYYYRLTQTNGSSSEEEFGRSTSVTIGDLTPYTEYLFTVLALTSVGPGPYSNPIIQRTSEDRPPKLLPPVSYFANTSVIQVAWKVPNPPHGVITEYEISYGRDNKEDGTIRITAAEAGEPPSCILLGLDASANYSVKVRAYTSIGFGPYSEPLVQITQEGLPDPPINLNVSRRTLNELVIEWDSPNKPRGKITKYEVQYQPIAKPYEMGFSGENPTTVNINDPKESNSHTITNLAPSTIYEIQVSAYTSAGQGKLASINGTTALFTDLEAVKVNEVSINRKETTAEIILPALTQDYATGYRIRIKTVQTKQKRTAPTIGGHEDNPDDYITAELDKKEEDRPFTIGDGQMYGGYFNAPLQKDKKYEMVINTLSKVGEEVQEVPSEAIPLYVEGGSSAALIVILTLLIIAAIVLVSGIIWYKRRDLKRMKDEVFQAKTGRKEVVEVPSKMVELEMTPSESLDNLANQDFNHSSPKGKQPVKKKSLKKMQKSVKIADLASYVKKKKMSEKDNFMAEYEMLPQGQLYSWDIASKPENKTKNRYGNIVPYDESRVILPVIHDNPHTDYINASYVNGYEYPNKYIASHGPNKASVLDFWRMVWLENCGKIVMLTNLSEGGKKKCEQYWPDDAMKYGNLKVVCTNTNTYPTCAIRTFALNKMDDEMTVKHVRHFHFTAWPDMKVPDFAGPLLDFIQLVREEDPHQDGPVVVHCSAGVGRTGTYITLEAMLDMAAAEKRINVFQFVSQMRERRIKMVQVVEQYQFIFDALVEYFVIGNTSIEMDTFRSGLTQLKRMNHKKQKSYLQEQFDTLQLISVTPPEEKFAGGKKPENRNKNRFRDCLPVDSHRPYLMTDVGSLGNNYINASFLGGAQQKDMFLATQMPLENTILDFWRMVWDYNSPAIVMLNDMHEGLVQYWPESGTYYCDPFTITLLSCNVQQGVRCRKLEIANPSQRIESPKEVMHLQCIDWPRDVNAPESPQTLLQAISMLNQWTVKSERGPITVHCINGVGRSGVFCSLVAALEQIKLEGKADVFQLINKMRNCRPNMVENFEQYQSIFDVILMHLEEDDNIYENYGK